MCFHRYSISPNSLGELEGEITALDVALCGLTCIVNTVFSPSFINILLDSYSSASRMPRAALWITHHMHLWMPSVQLCHCAAGMFSI